MALLKLNRCASMSTCQSAALPRDSRPARRILNGHLSQRKILDLYTRHPNSFVRCSRIPSQRRTLSSNRSLRVISLQCGFPRLPSNVLSRAREEPLMAVFVALLATGTFWGILIAVWFVTKSMIPVQDKYPEPLATILRNALWYSDYYPNPQLAAQYWAQALEECDASGLELWSNEVLGVRLQACAWLQKIGASQELERNLERIKTDLITWIASLEKDKNALGDQSSKVENIRGRLIGKLLQVRVRLAEVYSNSSQGASDKALEELISVTDTGIREWNNMRLAGKGPETFGNEVLSLDQLGAAFDRLAGLFVAKNRYDLALPLLLQALPLAPSAGITALTKTPVIIELLKTQTSPRTRNNPNPVTPSIQQALHCAAKNWASNALEFAKSALSKGNITEDDMNKCAVAAAAATLALGCEEEKAGNTAKAKKLFSRVLNDQGVGGVKIISNTNPLDARQMAETARQGLGRLSSKAEQRK